MSTKQLKNPIEADSITDFLASVLQAVIVLALPIIIFFLIYAGFLYVTARGNPEKIKDASTALLYGVIGGVIIIGAVAITAIVQSVVSSF